MRSKRVERGRVHGGKTYIGRPIDNTPVSVRAGVVSFTSVVFPTSKLETCGIYVSRVVSVSEEMRREEDRNTSKYAH